ncbi:Cystathionine beta-synthase, core domain protein, partial [mine drainage metagenome]
PKVRVRLERTPVRSIMSRPAVVTRPGETLARAAATMHARRFNRLPVVEEGRLLGVVTRGDLVRALANGTGPTTGR